MYANDKTYVGNGQDLSEYVLETRTKRGHRSTVTIRIDFPLKLGGKTNDKRNSNR